MSEETTKVITTQDPKYVIIGGQLANADTLKLIPGDEPIFIFRAKDIHAIAVIQGYEDVCIDDNHREQVRNRIEDFKVYAAGNRDLMNEPDSPVPTPVPEVEEDSENEYLDNSETTDQTKNKIDGDGQAPYGNNASSEDHSGGEEDD